MRIRRFGLVLLLAVVMLSAGCESPTTDTETTSTTTTSISTETTTTIAPTPTISSFTVAPANISQGQTAVLAWSVSDADQVQIDQGIGAVEASGSLTVAPDRSAKYTLTATSSGGTSQAFAWLGVYWNLTGAWKGTATSSSNEASQFSMTLIQAYGNATVTGTWLLSRGNVSGGGHFSGTFFNGALLGNLTGDKNGEINGVVTDYAKTITGSGWDQSSGDWTFRLTKQ
jgi:hypothetical protein